ncbi:PAS domain S-box protein, partial [Candidatus Binatia bacterium]|nr:PAS domain S-box protein [Candidatus Binatia bacterium]
MAARPVPDEADALARAVGGAHAAITLLDRDWRIVSVNQRSADLLGTSRESLLGRCVWDLYPGAATGSAFHAFTRAMREQVTVTLDQMSPSGGRSLQCIAVPSPDGLLVISRDVASHDLPRAPSPRPRVLHALERTDRRFRALIEHGLDALLMLDARGRVLYASPRVFGPRGLLSDDAGDHLIAHVHPDDAARVLAEGSRLLVETDGRLAMSCRFKNGDGQWIWVEGVAHNLLHDAAVGAIIVNCRDVTERRRAEEDLRFREQHFRALIEGALDLVTVIDDAGTVLYASPSHERLLGWRPEDITGRNAFDIVHPEDRDALAAAFARSIEDGTITRLPESRLRHADGSWRVFEATTHRTPPGSPIAGLIINAHDVTERRAAEQRTALLLELARELATSPDPEAMLERVGRHVAAALPCDLVGTCRWDALRRRHVLTPVFDLHPQQLGRPLDIPTPSGTRFFGRLADGPLVYADAMAEGGMLGEVARRLGIRRVVAAPLKSSARHHGALVAAWTGDAAVAAEHATLLGAIAGQLAVALERAELYRRRERDTQLFGALARVGRDLLAELDPAELPQRLCTTTAEALGCDVVHTLAFRPEEDAFALVAAYGLSRDALEALHVLRLPRALVEAVLRQGADVGVVTADGQDAGARLAAMLGVAAGHSLLLVALRRGRELIGLQTAVLAGPSATFDAVQLEVAGGLAHLASLALEHARAIEQLSRANGLKSDFVAMISHELRTPLNVILGYSDLLLEDSFGPLAEEQRDVLRTIHGRGHELLQLIRDVLDLSRLDSGRIPLDLANVALADLVASVEQCVRPLERPGEVELEIAVAHDVGTLLTDASKLSVVLKNLLANAFKFTTRGRVSLGVARCDGGVSFTVTDTGMGIPAELQQIIFEPFRQGDPTLTRRHGGVGLGLHIVQRMVEVLGGSVRVDSVHGSGSTFTVLLPDGSGRAPVACGHLPRTSATASSDAATGLPGTAVLRERLGAAMQCTDPAHAAGGLIYVALDAPVDDARRDALLCMVGERLASVLRATDTVARVGEGDFALLLPGRLPLARIEELGRRVLDVLAGELLVGDGTVRVHAAVGALAVRGGDPVRADDVLSRA